VAYIANDQMHLTLLWNLLQNGQTNLFWMGLKSLPGIHYFWLWFYLTFVVSSTMLPSTSDRHAWLPLGIIIIILFGLAIIAGAGPWMLEKLAPPMDSFLKAVSMLFGLSVMVHVILYLPLAGFHRILARVTGYTIK
jgi:hypothetical protein